MIALPFGTAIPSVRNGEFYRWFNSLTPKEFSKLWENPRLQGIIKQRLRSPGGFHEWLPVLRAAKFKEWGVTAEQIRDYRTPTGGVRFTKPGRMAATSPRPRLMRSFVLLTSQKISSRSRRRCGYGRTETWLGAVRTSTGTSLRGLK